MGIFRQNVIFWVDLQVSRDNKYTFLRFGKEEMGSYSSHLDWHFRARRRERDNARKAQSRLESEKKSRLYLKYEPIYLAFLRK